MRVTTDQPWLLKAYCANQSLEPSRVGTPYELGPVNDDPHLAELMTLVADKDLSEHGGLAQRAVWEVTDGEGLEEKTRAALRAL